MPHSSALSYLQRMKKHERMSNAFGTYLLQQQYCDHMPLQSQPQYATKRLQQFARALQGLLVSCRTASSHNTTRLCFLEADGVQKLGECFLIHSGREESGCAQRSWRACLRSVFCIGGRSSVRV